MTEYRGVTFLMSCLVGRYGGSVYVGHTFVILFSCLLGRTPHVLCACMRPSTLLLINLCVSSIRGYHATRPSSLINIIQTGATERSGLSRHYITMQRGPSSDPINNISIHPHQHPGVITAPFRLLLFYLHQVFSLFLYRAF